jgi:hypothetical protein
VSRFKIGDRVKYGHGPTRRGVIEEKKHKSRSRSTRWGVRLDNGAFVFVATSAIELLDAIELLAELDER